MAELKQNKRKYTTITIPTPLFENIRSSIKETGFSSVSDYVTFILRETVSEISLKRSKTNSKLLEKLKALGYM